MIELEENEALNELDLIKSQGFMSLTHFNVYIRNARQGLNYFGSEFEQALGTLIYLADIKTCLKILTVWPNECEKAAMLWKMHQAKEKAGAKE